MEVWVIIIELVCRRLELGYPPLDMGWYYFTMVILARLLCVFIHLLFCAYLLVSFQVCGIWCSMDVIYGCFSLNIFYRHANSCMDDSFMWCGILFLSVSARFVAATMMAYYLLTVGFVMYFCLKNTFPEIIVARVSFTNKFQHR